MSLRHATEQFFEGERERPLEPGATLVEKVHAAMEEHGSSSPETPKTCRRILAQLEEQAQAQR